MLREQLVEKVAKQLGYERVKVMDAVKGAVIVRWKRRPPVPPAPPAPSVPQQPKLIEHLLNDPLTPDLVKQVQVPSGPANSPFVVKNFKGGGYPRGSLEYQAANAYVGICDILNYVTAHSENTIPRWRRTSTLLINPRAGVDLNAYYDGRSLNFFYYADPRLGGAMYTVDSADIVTHECGHGILDCFRPYLWDAAFLEAGAFHEFFGDFCAIIHAFSHDEMINKAIAETGGDLKKSNVISRLAEQFGNVISKLTTDGRSPDYLRSAINSFKYVDPATLPEDAPDNQLAAEVHSFARVMLGAVYDIIVMIYDDYSARGTNQLDSARAAKGIIARYMMKAVQNAPLNARFFASVAKTLLWADVTLNNRVYHDRMHQIFMNRGILTANLQALSAAKCPNAHGIVKMCSHQNCKLRDHFLCAQGHEHHYNPLHDVEVSIPHEQANLFDKKGNMTDMITTTEEENLQGALDMVNYLHAAKLVGPDYRTPWEIRNGKLVRTRTCCCHNH